MIDDALVGREAELRTLTDGLEAALGGRGGLLFVTGEAGIGKTRLAREIAERAEARGAPAIWGRCWEGDGAPAYWPWVQVLRSRPIAERRDALIAELGPSAAVLGDLVPELAGGQGAPADSDDARFALFDAVARLLRAASARTPLVLLLDDLHWADRPSLLLLKFVARDLMGARLLIVGTFRAVEARLASDTHRLLAEAAREGRSTELGGLDPAEVARLAAGAGQVVDADLAGRLHRATAGNPFFVAEVLRLLATESPPAAGAPLPLPEGVREVIRRRFALLSDVARRLLGVASVIGREFDHALLDEVVGVAPGVLLDVLGAAADRGLVRPTDTPGRWAFGHDLVRETLYADLTAAERARIHGRVGDALERRSAGHHDPPLAELAHHFLASLPDGEAARALEWCFRAGRRAAALHADEDAVGHLRRALDVRDRFGVGDPRSCAELVLCLGQAELRAGEATAGHASCLRAAELATTLGATDLLARAAIAYGTVAQLGAVDPFHVALLERALAALAPDQVALRAHVMARLAAAMQPSPTPERPLAIARQALALARSLDDPAVRLAVLAAARPTFRVLDDLAERRAIDEEMATLAGVIGDPSLAWQAHRRLAFDHLEAGDVAGADLHFATWERIIGAPARPQLAVQLLLARAGRATMSGRFEDARSALLESDAISERLRVPFLQVPSAFPPYSQMERFLLARAEGDPDALEGFLARRWGPLDPVVRAGTLFLLGRLDEARVEYERVVAGGLPGPFNLFTRIMLPEVCAALDDTPRAERLLELLDPLAGPGRTIIWGGLPATCEGAVARLQGELLATLSRWDEAERRFREAIALEERMGALPWLARSLSGYARMLSRRGAPGDHDLARQLDARATATCERIGTRLPRRAGGVAAALAQQTVSAPATPTGAPELVREGEYWTIRDRGVLLRHKDSDGLRYLHHLVAQPGVEVHALDLLPLARGSARGGAPAADRGDAGPLLDATAKAAYRRRLADLRAALDEATAHHDPGRAARAREEMEFLTAELARAVGLGGRDRHAASAAERARVTVTLRIRSAIKKMEGSAPALAHHLRSCIQTGIFCCYRPPPAP